MTTSKTKKNVAANPIIEFVHDYSSSIIIAFLIATVVVTTLVSLPMIVEVVSESTRDKNVVSIDLPPSLLEKDSIQPTEPKVETPVFKFKQGGMQNQNTTSGPGRDATVLKSQKKGSIFQEELTSESVKTFGLVLFGIASLVGIFAFINWWTQKRRKGRDEYFDF